MAKRNLGVTVLEAAKQRIDFVFENFSRVYLSFSGGKDSSVMLHLVANAARKHGRKFGLLFVDLEAQYQLTADHVEECFDMYSDLVEPYWCCAEIALRNAVSQYEPKWMCWQKDREKDWVRKLPKKAFDLSKLPFNRAGMEFEEFVPQFGHWYSKGELTACFVGIRTQESLNRWRTIASKKKSTFEGKYWTTWCSKTLYNCYPIYDWVTEDIWTAVGKFDWVYNRLYDRMNQAGLTIHQQRICQPYGDDQRKGLWLFHLIEPETWARVVARVNGANSGALYSREKGNINGTIKVTKPDGHTWESFSLLLLESLPEKTKDHYKDKITMFLHWYRDRGYPDGIPDEGPANDKENPSWTRIAKVLLRNDYWCKGLSFTQTKSDAYGAYKNLMKKRRKQWNLIG